MVNVTSHHAIFESVIFHPISGIPPVSPPLACQDGTLNYFEFVSELIGRQQHDARASQKGIMTLASGRWPFGVAWAPGWHIMAHVFKTPDAVAAPFFRGRVEAVNAPIFPSKSHQFQQLNCP